ncbi:hypothetical protein [Hyphococcus sp.]|uniref:hypothetical protein n=1 Tax=Hyphococcus sp. TaxID=2038636 RepID=UPI003CCBCC4C
MQEFLGGSFVLIVELGDGLEEHFKVVGRLAFPFIEDQGVGANVKRQRDLPQRLDRGLVAPRLVAVPASMPPTPMTGTKSA